MNYRLADILAEKPLGTTTTEVIDLNILDPISRIEIIHRPTSMSAAMDAAFAAQLLKIELVDGSDVLHSLNGYQNQALLLYDRRVPSLNGGMLLSGATQYILYGIDFGRFLYDPELAFDPKRFRNPQLKITHDSTAIGSLTVTHTLQVVAHCFDEKAISPIGFLSAKQLFSYVSAHDETYEYVTLPTDRIIRQILLRGFKKDYDAKTVVDHFRLSEDNDKRIPIDVELGVYSNMMRGVWQQIVDQVTEYAATGETYCKYVTPTEENMCVSGMDGAGGDGTPKLYGATTGGKVAWLGTAAICGLATGYIPHHTYQFPFGKQQDLDDWYDVTKLGSLVARLRSGSESGANSEISLALQQLRRY